MQKYRVTDLPTEYQIKKRKGTRHLTLGEVAIKFLRQ
jgi:hypothetical protein